MSKPKRRTYSSQFKFETVMEGLHGEKSITTICRERDSTESLYYKWRDVFVTQAPTIFAEKSANGTVSDDQQARIADLERMVGKPTMQLEILKKPRTG